MGIILGSQRAGKSGDQSHAVQTLRVGVAAPDLAPAFGLRVLEHRFGARDDFQTCLDQDAFLFRISDSIVEDFDSL